MKQLTKFEGQQVASVGVEIPSAGGGLHEAMKIEPREFHHGDKAYIVMEVETAKIRFDAIKDTDDLMRVHVMRVLQAAYAEKDLVESILEAQRKRLDELKGEPQLPLEKTAGGDVDSVIEAELERIAADSQRPFQPSVVQPSHPSPSRSRARSGAGSTASE